MSSLLFCTDETQAMVATDTLAVTSEGDPAYWTSKAFIVPHLRMIIAGTGVSGFAGKWFIEVNDRMILRDIDNLDFHAPRQLQVLWADWKSTIPTPDEVTTTIYHFGFALDDGLMRTHVYRSINNFQSERLPIGMGGRPDFDQGLIKSLPDDFVAAMQDQRRRQAMAPASDRIHIGGEVQLLHLTASGFRGQSIYRFDDYDDAEKAMSP